MTERKDQICCCDPMINAQEFGTDNEAYGALVKIWYGEIKIGCGLSPITFCPWCGKKIESSKI